jgi:TrmH family RNA methyltransferase
MLSNSQSKYINSLSIPKFRAANQHFIVEGAKIGKEWLNSTQKIQYIIALTDWIIENETLIQLHPEAQVVEIDAISLKKISQLQTPNQVLLVVAYPPKIELPQQDSWMIALDGIRDPGNMGTIMRIADWYGIQHILCSGDCVDVYNTKVVQAAMGAHLRVNTHLVSLKETLETSQLTSYAATLNGENIYQIPCSSSGGIIVIGNEAFGISPEVIETCNHKVTIPRIGGAESLNAAISTGIFCALLIGS